MNQRIRCPNPVCPQPDDVQKVSVVAQSGTIQGSIGGTIDVTSTSVLSGQLAAPMKPERTWGCGALFWFGFFALLSIASIVSGILLALGYTNHSPAATMSTSVIGAVVCGVIAILIFVANLGYKGAYNDWLGKMAKWEQLYYCNRCGSVFNPAEAGRFVPASHMKELLA